MESNISLPDQSSERKGLQASHDRLEKDNIELRRSNIELEDFASTASHDLQAPLRGIAQMAQFLEEDYGDKLGEDASDMIHSIVRNAKRMKLLMDDLLQYAKLSSGIPLEEGKKVPAQEALAQALENLEEYIKESGAIITYDDLPSGHLNGTNLAHVFQNLIANAINYRRSDPPEVHITAKKEADHWLFHISDNGIGIEEKYYERIFEPFKRLHGQDVPGTGLGLAVCKKIIERLGGEIWVSSQKDKGSDFYFTLPSKIIHHIE